MITLLVAAGVATAAPSPVPASAAQLEDAALAISAGRLDQARLMISRAVARGASGRAIDRLLADLSFASGKYDDALTQYRELRKGDPSDASVCEPGAIAALKTGHVEAATPLAECATAMPGATWRAWNARGVLADLKRDWEAADEAYGQASSLAPNEAVLANNRGWSHILRGDWLLARDEFEKARELDPKAVRIANNLELARAALATELPRREPGESDRSWAERLNDAGVAAHLLGDRKRAIAAFTQALQASDSWYSLAADNLEAVSKP